MDRTPCEKRNDERFKAIIREWLQSKLEAQERLMHGLLSARPLFDVPFTTDLVRATESRIGVLLWLIGMTKESDPNQVNQWNASDGPTQPTVSA